MAKISRRSRGSVEDMLNVFKHELRNADVESTTSVEASINYKGYKIEYNKEFKSYDVYDNYDLPSKNDFASVNEAKKYIDSVVNAAINIQSSDDAVDIVSLSSDEIEDYLLDVEMFVRDNAEGEVDSLDFSVDFDENYPSAGNFICTTVYNDKIIDMEIPFEDLEFNDVELDGMYIVNSIVESIEETLGHRDYE